MHLLEVALLFLYTVLIQGDIAYESGQGYYDDPEFGDFKEHPGKELEEQLRAVSSVDELMTLLYPESWKMFKCQLRQGGQSNFDTRREEKLKFAAAHSNYNTEIWKSIESEWRKTQCIPREVCVDVGKEFGASTSTFFKPPCVSLYRCGGCCNSEGMQCMNTSSTYVSKTLFEITVPLSQGPIKPVTISFANHTSCRCMSKLDVYRQVHSIIRRSLPATQVHCQVANKTCPRNYIWHNHLCKCIEHHELSSHPEESDSSEAFHDICGPNKELDEETCQCVCKGGLLPSSCGPHRELDRTSCQCMCKNKLLSTSCGSNKEYDEERCQCVCKKSCPKHQPLNPIRCACECVETPNKCFLRGKRFNHQTCSCYRPPCTTRPKRCESGFYYSEEVCRCVPTYWKRPHMN